MLKLAGSLVLVISVCASLHFLVAAIAMQKRRRLFGSWHGNASALFSGQAQQRGTSMGAPLFFAKPSNGRSRASHEVKDDGNNGQYQKNVDEKRRDVEHEKTAQPQQEQNEPNR